MKKEICELKDKLTITKAGVDRWKEICCNANDCHVTMINTRDRPLFTDPVLVEYNVVPCPMYQHFPGQEQAGFFQNVPNNVTGTFQLSTLWEHLKSTGSCDQNVPNQQLPKYFLIGKGKQSESDQQVPKLHIVVSIKNY